jgi:hypothetical protein
VKKTMNVLVVIGAAVLALSTAYPAYAQTEPPTPKLGDGFGPGVGGPNGEGPLHDVMISILAPALGITPEELEQRRDAGETFYQIAIDLGFSEAELPELIIEAKTAALAQAVEEGLITQEQADWMIARMAQMRAAGYGPGTGNCGGPGMGWQGQAP